jgi:hypothetical protein
MKPIRTYLCFLLLLFFYVDARAQIIDNGKWYTKTLGNSFSAQVKPDEENNRVDLVLYYKTQAVVTLTLTETDTATIINGRWNNASINGNVKLRSTSKNPTSTLDASLKLTDAGQVTQFTGQLAGWKHTAQSATASIVQDGETMSYDLGTVCSVKTTISGENRDITTIAFYYVNTLMYTITLTPVTPTATIPTDLIIGSLFISKGAKLDMQVPSTLQSGSVMLNCVLKSGDHDPVQFSAQVATWSFAVSKKTDRPF